MPKKNNKVAPVPTTPPKPVYSQEDLQWAVFFSENHRNWFDFVLRWPRHSHHELFKHCIAEGLIVLK